MPPQPFKCEGCHAVEYHQPFRLCTHCNQEFREIKAFCTNLRRRFDLWGMPECTEVVRTVLNRLAAQVNDLVKRKDSR